MGYSYCQEVICNGHRQLCMTAHFCSYYKKRVPCHISCFPKSQNYYNFACRYWIVWLFSMVLLTLMQPCTSLHLSLPSSLSASTQATTLFSRQSTLEDLDGIPECIPKTSERARPKLRKMYSMDVSNSSMDSGSSFMSRCLASAPRLCLPTSMNTVTACSVENRRFTFQLFFPPLCLFVDYMPQKSQRSLKELQLKELFVIPVPGKNLTWKILWLHKFARSCITVAVFRLLLEDSERLMATLKQL